MSIKPFSYIVFQLESKDIHLKGYFQYVHNTVSQTFEETLYVKTSTKTMNETLYEQKGENCFKKIQSCTSCIINKKYFHRPRQ